MNLQNLEKIFTNKPAFQLRQAKEAVFKHLIKDWSEATNLPIQLRETLNKECPLNIQAEFFISDDKNTIKAILSLSDSDRIETVLMRYENGRNTICVSSQVGCPLGCLFCATGRGGFKRNLSSMEIIEQVVLFARYLKKNAIVSPFEKGGLRGILKEKIHPSPPFPKEGVEHVNNIVFMGMGEPFLNYENVMAAIKILNNQKDGLSIGARHISISTVGITEGIEKLSDEPLQVNLAISLHAPNNELRSKIVP
ncbi:MAG: radical SAM protein, partial [bacterium]|nr:radical SAM protein [bacterium]